MPCYIFNYRLKKCFQYVNEDLRDDSDLKNIGKINKGESKQSNFFKRLLCNSGTVNIIFCREDIIASFFLLVAIENKRKLIVNGDGKCKREKDIFS